MSHRCDITLPVSRRLRIALGSVLALLTLLAIAAVCVYLASQQVPEFYSNALALDPADLRQASDRMLRRSAALSNDVRKSGTWQQAFTDAEINGWLAVDVPKNHPTLIPEELSEPRVCLTPSGVQVGARVEGSGVAAVVSLEFDLGLQSTNVIAVRIRKVRVGDLPWRLDTVVNAVVRAADNWDIVVQQSQIDGDPLLLLTLPATRPNWKSEIRLERLQLRAGEIVVSGVTTKKK